MTTPAPRLELADLTVEIPTPTGVVTPVIDVSLSVARGETVALVGETGAGKSTVGRAITGLLRPPAQVTAGEIRLDGDDVVSLSPRRRRALLSTRISTIPQDSLSSLNPVMPVGKQIREVFTLRGGRSRTSAKRAAIDVLERVGIAEPSRAYHRLPHELSGGMRQRILIGIAVAIEPDVIIADEPTTALDVSIQAQILELLDDLIAANDTTLVLITHDLSVVWNIADTVAVMYAGHVVEHGPTRQIFEAPQHPYTVGLLTSIPRSDVRRDRQQAIEGSPPDLHAIPDGCAFAPRCPRAIEDCTTAAPPAVQVGPGHTASCIRVDDIERSPR